MKRASDKSGEPAAAKPASAAPRAVSVPVAMPLSLPMLGPMPASGRMPTSISTPASPPRLTLLTKPGGMMTALCGGTVDGDTLYLVGGLGSSLVLRCDDGETLVPVKAPGRGLRAIVVDGDTVWLAGEYGTLFRSRSGFDAFEPIATGAQACLHGLVRDAEGAIWVGGDGGLLRRSTDGETFEPVAGIPETILKMSATEGGVFIPSAAGLWRSRGAAIEQLGLTRSVNQVIVTRAGTLLAAGAKNHVYRSTDGGTTFHTATLPPFQQTELPAERQLEKPYWVKPSQDINLLAQLADGRIVAVGDHGVILVSADDGQTFARVEHEICDGSFWALGVLGDKVFFGGGNRVVLRVDP
jgi:hypothetical protein